MRQPLAKSVYSFAALVAIFLSGCTSPQSVMVDESRPRTVYYVSSDPTTQRTEDMFRAANGRDLGFVRHHQPGRKAPTAMVYLHGIESHAGWFDEAADLLAQAGYDVFCLDRRGSGINRENRGFASGHLDDFCILFDDIHTFIQPLRRQYDHVVLVGLSWGGKVALAHTLVHPDDCDGMILITPGLRAKVKPSLLMLSEIVWLPRTEPVKIPLTPDMFTDEPDLQEKMRNDPLKLDYVTAGFFLQSAKLDGFVDKRIAKNQLPILLVLAGQDRIIDNEASAALLLQGKQEHMEIVNFQDQTHSVQIDAPDRLVEAMKHWTTRITSSASVTRNPLTERSHPCP